MLKEYNISELTMS